MIDGIQDNQTYQMRFSLVAHTNANTSFVDKHPLQVVGRVLADSKKQIAFSYDMSSGAPSGVPASMPPLLTMIFGPRGSSLALSVGGFVPVASNGVALLNGPSSCAPVAFDVSRLNGPASASGTFLLGTLACESTWNTPSTLFSYDYSIVRKTEKTCIHLSSTFDRAPGYEYCWADDLSSASISEQSGAFVSQWSNLGPATAPGSESIVKMLAGIREGVSFRLRYKEDRDATFFAAGPTELTVVGRRWPNGDAGMEFYDPNDSTRIVWAYRARAGLTGLTSFLAYDGLSNWPPFTELGPVPYDPVGMAATSGPVVNNPSLGDRLVSFANLSSYDTSACLGFTRGLPTVNIGYTFCWSNDLQRTLMRQFGRNSSTTYYTDQDTARTGL